MIKFLFFLQRLFQFEKTWWWIAELLKKNKKFHKTFYNYFFKWECDKNGFSKFALAYCYDKGIFVEENPKKAFEYANESAQQGNAFGLNLLGIFFENGYGTDCNPSKACELYIRSAKMGCSHGMTSLVNYYIEIDHPQTKVEINNYLILAARKKNPYALNLLGMLFIRGKYVPLNCNIGFKLCYASARKRNYYGILSVIYICNHELVKMSNNKRKRIIITMHRLMNS